MFPAQRRRQIAQQINEQGYVSIAKLCDQFQVSEMTIHRDLYALEELGQIKKTRGGAVSYNDLQVPVSYRARAAIHEEDKDKIGKKAAELIHDGETVYLDASTTSMYIAKNLGEYERLTVYTHGHMISTVLAEKQGVDVYSTGGMLSKDTMAFVGSYAERAIGTLRPDKCFIGAAGISLDEGVLDPFYPEASMKRVIVDASREVFLVAVSDKFDKIAPHVSVPIEMIDVIITDSSISEKYVEELGKKGIRCLLV
jgi:DeoR/GlpR family transcriptional regulator of sugar metabolism